MQHNLCIVKEDDLDYLIGESKDDCMLSSHPFLDKDDLFSLSFHKEVKLGVKVVRKVAFEVLKESDFLLKGLGLVVLSKSDDVVFSI
jgi:hypothetical protein